MGRALISLMPPHSLTCLFLWSSPSSGGCLGPSRLEGFFTFLGRRGRGRGRGRRTIIDRLGFWFWFWFWFWWWRGMEGEECGNGGGEVRVLVVDDSPVDRKIVERLLLRSAGIFQVIAVDSGKKAMEVLGLSEEKPEALTANEQKIDIILTDYCMPEMTGYDLLKAVKEHSCPKSIPVVIMSSENDPQRIRRCRDTGAEDFILKPLQIKDVQRLRKYAKLVAPAPRTGSKRKLSLDMIPESNGSERRPRLAGVAVA